MTRLFMSYRRDDSGGYTQALYDDLVERFGRGCVFKDHVAIPGGADFVATIQRAIATADALIVVIGPRWLSVTGRTGLRRLDAEDDPVRMEIATALQRGLRVFPVLVGDAEMPSSADLPEPIRALARQNAVELSDARWDYDVGRLVHVIEAGLPRVARLRTSLMRGRRGVVARAATLLATLTLTAVIVAVAWPFDLETTLAMLPATWGTTASEAVRSDATPPVGTPPAVHPNVPVEPAATAGAPVPAVLSAPAPPAAPPTGDAGTLVQAPPVAAVVDVSLAGRAETPAAVPAVTAAVTQGQAPAGPATGSNGQVPKDSPSNPATATGPELVGVSFQPSAVEPGQTVTMTYEFVTAGGAPVPVVLGASIRLAGGPWIDDPANDARPNLAPGRSIVTRPFRVPAGTVAGSYDVWATALTTDLKGRYGERTMPGGLTVTAARPPASPQTTPRLVTPTPLPQPSAVVPPPTSRPRQPTVTVVPTSAPGQTDVATKPPTPVVTPGRTPIPVPTPMGKPGRTPTTVPTSGR